MRLLEQLQAAVAAGGCAPPADDHLEAQCPNLWELLTVDRWADDTIRILPEITIERVPGGFKATIKDHSLLIRKSALCLTAGEVFTALETAISDVSTPWEGFQSYRNKKGAKVIEEKPPRQRKRK